MSLIRKLPQGFSWVMVEGAVGTTLTAAFGILCARYWGPEISGMTALAFTVASLTSFASCLSIEQFVIARYVGCRQQRRLFLATLTLRSAASLLALIAMLGISVIRHDLLGPWLWLPTLALCQFILGNLDLLRLRAQALHVLHWQSRPRMIMSCIFFVLKWAAIDQLPAEQGVWASLWLGMGENILSLLLSWVITRSYCPFPQEAPPSGTDILSEIFTILRASLPLFAAGIVVVAFLKLDYFMLAELSSPRDIGLYASAMRVMELYVSVGNLALLQFYPTLASVHGQGEEPFLLTLRRMFRLAYCIGGGIVVCNWLVGEYAILWLLGPQYAEVARHSTAFCLLSLPLLSGTVRGFAISLQGLHGHHFYSAFAGFTLALPMMFVLIPSLGFLGALASDLIAYFASAMVTTFLLPDLRPIARHQWFPGWKN